MAFKTAIASLALGMVMFGSTAAQAAEIEVGFRVGGVKVHVHSDSCHHAPAPQPPPRAQGRYELQTVNRWVEGRHERVWVPEVCREKHRRHARITKCTGGYYEDRWVEGYYEPVEQWVWVPAQDDGWRSRRVHNAGYYR